jgi:hypothetical protein
VVRPAVELIVGVRRRDADDVRARSRIEREVAAAVPGGGDDDDVLRQGVCHGR